MSSWVPPAPLSRRNVPLWSSIQREGELPPVATFLGDIAPQQGLEQQLCLVLWLGNARESPGSHRMAQGNTATMSGDIAQHALAHPITSGRIHRSISLSPSSLGKAEDSIQGQVESFQGWDFGDTHPTELSQCSWASPGEPEGTHKHPIALPLEGWDSQNKSKDPGAGKAPVSPRLAKKSSATAGDLRRLMQGVTNSYSSTRRVKRGATHWVELGGSRGGPSQQRAWSPPPWVTIIWGNNPRAPPRGCGASAPHPRFGCSRRSSSSSRACRGRTPASSAPSA